MALKFKEHLTFSEGDHGAAPADYNDSNHPMYPIDLEAQESVSRKTIQCVSKKIFGVLLGVIAVLAITWMVTFVGLQFGKHHPSTFGPQGPSQAPVTVHLSEVLNNTAHIDQLQTPTPITRSIIVTATRQLVAPKPTPPADKSSS